MTAPEDPYRRPEQPAWDAAPTWGQPAPQGYGAPPPSYGPAPVGYGGPAYGPPRSTSSLAVVALVLAIGSFTVPLIPAIVALVLVPRAQEEIDLSGGRVGGDGVLTATKVIAWINIALCVGGFVLALAAFALFAGVGFS